MSQATDSHVSIALNKDVMLTPETQQLLEGLGIKHKETSQYELIGSVLSHKHVVKSFIVLKMRVTAILKAGIPFADMDDVIAITLSNIIPISTTRQTHEVHEEVYRVTSPILTNNIGIMPNEELVVRRSGDLLSLAHQQFEIQLNEADLKRIRESSIRKDRFALIMPDATMWRVVALHAYSLDEVIQQVNGLDACTLISRCSVDTGFYSTSALFKFDQPIYSYDGQRTDVLSWLRYAYEYGELPDNCDRAHPAILNWKAMVKAPDFDTQEFAQFMVFHACRHRSLLTAAKVEDNCVVTANGPMRPRDFFAQFDETSHAHQS